MAPPHITKKVSVNRIFLFIFIIVFFAGPILSQKARAGSNKSGGYISFGVQIGKEKTGDFFWGLQITFARHIPLRQSLYDKGVPYVFPGLCFGLRKIKKTSLFYLDGQLSLWSIITGGFGFGRIWGTDKPGTKATSTFRKKYWAGIGIIPCLVTFDNHQFPQQSKQCYRGLFFNPFIKPFFDDYFKP